MNNLFDEYEAFVDKFKPKKTTDDCYTPPAIYDCVLNWVAENYDLAGMEVVRPFYPGGDYKKFIYPENCIVIDNPPFSIIAEICRYYTENNIKYFLFSPHLTLFSSLLENCTYVVCGADIIYENGAQVKTSFRANIFPDTIILGVPDLYNKLKEANKKKDAVTLPKYQYPDNVLTVSMVSSIVEKGIPLNIAKKDVAYCKALESQKNAKKSIFGNGFLISNEVAAEKLAAEKLAAEKLAAEKSNDIVWKLSDREIDLIKSLGK
ncbi:hypothetical protein M2451_003329 [Dysgonomonas sp. PFB1-18]|uniref:chromosome partitioning protein ParB n=1 Tax=unclassified Dysgonomonas TaxID=2630389 RepID=UPI0024748BC0|nr:MULTISPECIES: chromosome partitioning protein ParB [unclassified Dysgonomonas]MDH6310581.1 hypothetical protein [Dysgonomonas sp. PF1-14]MDH6340431.1 hypothetical protein [Dysgonomonas sp. PF1-16]MDH6381989.1 hypothetical protein [Dysgonomonas sp. PFB1-18]MDH6399402.1 hypothetical protein [Dysgonomonas sp. PF1-23]